VKPLPEPGRRIKVMLRREENGAWRFGTTLGDGVRLDAPPGGTPEFADESEIADWRFPGHSGYLRSRVLPRRRSGA
jgi:hypothetical protein